MTDSKKVLVSTHGKKLISKLTARSEECNGNTCNRLDEILQYLKIDPLAARYCQPDNGNNSFHIVLSSNEDITFLLPVLLALLQAAPLGLCKQNKNGFQPIHLYLMQPVVHSAVIQTILESYPHAASLADADGFIPLFYYVMREDACADICKMLCKAFPLGPATTNRSNSFPLHFASKRFSPNLDVLRILIRRYPLATSHINDFGMLPLHCICSASSSIQAVKIIYKAYPEGGRVKDRQGRLPLHLAVLRIGKHQRLFGLPDQMEQLTFSTTVHEEGTLEIDKYVQIDRTILQYLIEVEPMALATTNNFEALPVDTVLESAKPMKSRKKTVQIYGLYDDPLTARILLIAHKIFSLKRMMGFPVKYEFHLHNLNWIARRDAMLVSYQYEPIPGSENWKAFRNFKLKLLSSPENQVERVVVKNKKSIGGHRTSENFSFIVQGDDFAIPENNYLAKLRRRGFLDLVRHVILFI